MAIKLGIQGIIKRVHEVKLDGKPLICLEVEAQSEKSHSNLSIFSSSIFSTIELSVLVRQKVFNSVFSGESFDLLVGEKLEAKGVLSLDIPMSLIDGEIAMIAYDLSKKLAEEIDLRSNREKRIENATLTRKEAHEKINLIQKEAADRVKLIKKEAAEKISLIQAEKRALRALMSFTYDIPIEEIDIPDSFAEPNPNKMLAKLEEYQVNPDLTGVLVYPNNGKLTLYDGYTKYLIALDQGITRLQVEVICKPKFATNI
ncbi:hypothetical protein M2444_006783 [Paenibacillus sp. PastF-3]|uniref:hypothetical protein n=1 Tax=unclassified Paenibacillus TaxID=185978 RepID=UPI002473700A|nr:hypothetical protein [Paenibacillus sp. PastF-3]MDH6374919.1 hypothetical protein [Paenibacillus sp. PastF-3]